MYLTEAGEYTISIANDNYMVAPKTFSISNADLMTHKTFRIMDPVVDVSSTIVKEIVAPLVVYLGTNTIMNIFEKNKLSFSVPINSTVIDKDGTTHKSSDDRLLFI